MFMPLAALAAVAALLPPAIALARRGGFVDAPGGRKRHEDAVPPVGGLVIFPVMGACAVLAGVDLATWGWFLAALALLVAVGGLDDRRPVRPAIKFAAHFAAAALIVVPGGAQIVGMGDILGLGMLWLGWAAIPFSVVAVVLLINAINLVDGLDGLAGGIGFVAAAGLAACALLGGAVDMAGAAALLMAALAGFLLYNMRAPWRARAAVFMGDSGSLGLGLTLAWLAITISDPQRPPAVMPMAVAWILALPIFDICGQFARRVSQGRHPFDADSQHFHHHFINAGLSVGQATAAILAISAVFAAVGVTGAALDVPQAWLSWPWIGLLLLHIYMSLRPHRFRRLIARLRGGA
jgi:UDP-GlcNAc:undecaprenyl-phosphate GlcNAc-1-phosphate transferase